MPHKVCASGTLMAEKNRLVNGVQNTLCTNFFENFRSLPATLLHTTMQHPTSLWGFLSQPPCYPLQPNPPLLYPSARGEQCIEVNWSLLSPCWWAAKICRRQANPKIKLGLQKSLEVLRVMPCWFETSLVSCQESCVHRHLSDETSHLHKYRGGAMRWLEF